MGLTARVHIPDGAVVLVDSSPLIYVLEGHPLGREFEPVFADIDAGRIQALITPITLAEVLAGPLKARDEAAAARYRHALTANPGWTVRDIDAEIAVLAARLRLRHRLKLPDALQLAVAVQEGCAALVTHDRDFSGVDEFPLLQGPGR